MVPFSAVTVDVDKTIASQMTSLKYYAQAGSEISQFTHQNWTTSSMQIMQLIMMMLSSAHC